MDDLVRIVEHQISAMDESDDDVTARAELDSHADTTCIGNQSMIIGTTYKTVRVTPFLESLGSVHRVPVVNAALAYDDPRSGETMILIFHQVLYFKEMFHHLLSPMQMRMNDLVVNETPKFLTETPDEKDHAIIVGELLIPLELKGVISYFPVRKPTVDELETCVRVEMTAQAPAWHPHSEALAEEESLVAHSDGSINHQYERRIFSVELDPSHVFPSYDTVALLSSKSQSSINPQVLAKFWGIGLEAARKTIAATTQRAIRSTPTPSVERRWPTNDRSVRYKRLAHTVYHDTLYSQQVSMRMNKCSEIYATDFGWSRNFPMRKESDVHETLKLFLTRFGIPEALISDGARALIAGRFKQAAREAGCHLKLTDPYSPLAKQGRG
jgi:hypothetical protein